MLGPIAFEWIHDRGERRRDHYLLNSRSILLNRLQNAGRANDRRIQQLFLYIGDVVMKRAGGVDNDVERWVGFHRFIKGTLHSDVLDDNGIEFILPKFGMGGLDALCFRLTAYSDDYRVATDMVKTSLLMLRARRYSPALKENLEDVSGDEATPSSKQDSGHIAIWLTEDGIVGSTDFSKRVRPVDLGIRDGAMFLKVTHSVGPSNSITVISGHHLGVSVS